MPVAHLQSAVWPSEDWTQVSKILVWISTDFCCALTFVPTIKLLAQALSLLIWVYLLIDILLNVKFILTKREPREEKEHPWEKVLARLLQVWHYIPPNVPTTSEIYCSLQKLAAFPLGSKTSY